MPGKTENIELSELEMRDFVITQKNGDAGKIFKLARLSRKQIAAWRSDALQFVECFEELPESSEKFKSLLPQMNMLMAIFSYHAYVPDEATPGALRLMRREDATEISTIISIHLATIELHRDIIPPELKKLNQEALAAAVERDGPSVIFEDWKH